MKIILGDCAQRTSPRQKACEEFWKIQARGIERARDIREDEAVAVDPFGVLRVEGHELVPQDVGNRGHAHGRTRVAGVGLGRSIDLEGAFGSATELRCGNCLSGSAAMTGCCC